MKPTFLQVAKRPIETILSCVLLTLVSTVGFHNFQISTKKIISQVGFFNFNAQTDRVKLWIPAGSVTRDNSLWLNSHYPPDVRYQSAIVKVNMYNLKYPKKPLKEYIGEFHCDFSCWPRTRKELKRVFKKYIA